MTSRMLWSRISATLFLGKSEPDYLRLLLINLTLWSTMLLLPIFGLLNLTVGGRPLLGTVELLLTGVCLGLLQYLHIHRRIETTALITTLLIAAFFSYLTLGFGGIHFVVSWMLIFPLYAFTLLGRRRGLLVTLSFFVVNIPLLVKLAPAWAPVSYDFGVWLNLFGTTVVIALLAYHAEAGRQNSLDALRTMAHTDPLTQVANRREFTRRLDMELSRAQRSGAPCSLLIMDLDHFKQVNDHHGHDAGDQALVTVSQTITDVLRKQDLLARVGGEEFAVILPETALDDALTVAEKVRQQVAAINLRWNGETVPLRISIGAAEYGHGVMTYSELFTLADEQLFRAKKAGRNRVMSPRQTT